MSSYREVSRTTRPDGTEVVVVENGDKDPRAPMYQDTVDNQHRVRWYAARPTRFILSVLLIAVGTLAVIVGVGMTFGRWQATTITGVVLLLIGLLLGYDGTD